MSRSEGRGSQAPTRLSYPEFLKWCDEDTWAEWVEGEVVMVSPASRKHQELADFLSHIIGIYVEAHDLGRTLSAPFQMYLSDQARGREPDLLFIAKAREPLLKESYLDGPADLVVEIVSPESRERDRGEKFAEYEAAGVREYWLIDPDDEHADFFVLGDDGRYEPRSARQGIYRSPTLEGFELNVNWLWQQPLPPVLQVLRELKLV